MCAGSGLVQREHHRLGHILGRELVPLRGGDDGDAGLDWTGLCARGPALASCYVGGAAVPDLVSFIPAFAATDPSQIHPRKAPFWPYRLQSAGLDASVSRLDMATRLRA